MMPLEIVSMYLPDDRVIIQPPLASLLLSVGRGKHAYLKGL